MWKKILLCIGVIVVSGIAFVIAGNRGVRAPSFVDDPKGQATPTSFPRSIRVILREENKSGESGIATLTQKDRRVVVEISLINVPNGAAQPAHIHAGECPGVGSIEFPLATVIEGKSETILDTSLDSLLAKKPLAINVHKSNTEAQKYISCGEIDLTNGSS